ncbi:MAG TPA: ABC transporter substrate-binding protein [Thermomicrobiales bacterium]
MNGDRVRLSRRRFVQLSAGSAAAATVAGSGPFLHQASAQGLPEVPREKTLILVGVGGESPNQFTDVDNVNALGPSGSGLSRSGYQLVYEPLWFYNMLNGEEKPWLAESYQYNADFTEVSVKLRQGVEWSDGTPFTSNDVQYSFHTVRDTDGLDHHTELKQWVKEVAMTDDLNLTFKLNAPNPRFFFEYCTFHADIGQFIVPKHIFEGQDPMTFKNFDLAKGWPVATGPYKLVASSAEQKVWDLRTDWWAAKTGFAQLPAPERLIFLPGYDEAKMAQMVIANEADATLNISPATIPTLFAQNPKIITHSGHDLPYGYTDWWPSGLGFNCEVEPWNDPEIRWAMSYAIDRDQLVQFGYRGAGEPTVLPYPYYAPLKTYVDAAKDLLTQYPTNLYDPSKTEEILTRKGYAKGGDGFWAKDGQKLSMVITTFSVFADLAPFVTQQLQNAGIDASFQMPTTFFNDLSTGQDPAYIWGHGGSVRDPFKTMELYHQKFYQPTGTATYPFYRWRNDEYDAIVDEMGVTDPDDPKTMELFLKGTEIWLKELPDPPLLQFYHRIPMNTTYWTNWPTADNPYINGSFWHRTVLLIVLGLKSAAA